MRVLLIFLVAVAPLTLGIPVEVADDLPAQMQADLNCAGGKGCSPEVQDVVCPGGQATCPDGNTCCLLSSGQYGCCPLPNAVCCSDGQHCCPQGYTCDVSQGTCSRGNEITAWFEKSASSPVEVQSVVCPGGQATCPDGNTCCLLSSGQYGCCPLPNAVCCSDHEHCCPQGYTCDVSSGACSRGDDITAWFEKTASSPVEVQSVVCPGGQAECPDGNTCCLLSSGQYGCCPLPNAVCCSDGQHCCPQGYTCDVSQGTCSRGNEITSWFEKSASSPLGVRSVVCPGGQAECPDGNTCCLLSSGQYGCCPLPNAVCCSDHEHCCPQGYTCDVSTGACSRGNEITAWFEKSASSPVEVQDVVCPGGQATCQDGNTCCLLSSGQYGCCPLPNAVCCSDGQHCCPQGYTCDVSQGTCSRGNEITSWFEKSASSPVEVQDVVCPGGQATCPDGNTCCLLSSGQYGCCPLPNAVCCSDHEHCCPQGYTCDVSTGACSRGNEITAWFEKSASSPVEVQDVVCPGGQATCPDGNTCCLLSSGQYGCCPLPNAVCCSDGQHCCPQGYTCDVSQGTCSRGNEITAWFEKTASSPVEVQDVVCPGGQATCPDGNTCCLLSSGQYGCCPMPNAVCCSDGQHCCPQGYTCDVSQGTCSRGNEITSWFEKSASSPVSKVKGQREPVKHLLFEPEVDALKVEENDVELCPDQVSTCPQDSTCCQTPGGIYGCCPYPAAICCADLIHCCPAGYSCETKTGTCTNGDHIMAWVGKTPLV